MTYTCGASTPPTLDLTTLTLSRNTRQRVVLSWDTDPGFTEYATRPSVDVDLRVVDASGAVVASSASWDNTNEIVDFRVPRSGKYTLQAIRFRCNLSNWLGWAWYSAPKKSGP